MQWFSRHRGVAESRGAATVALTPMGTLSMPNLLCLNPPSFTPLRYVKEGICQGPASAGVWPPVTLAALGAIAKKAGFHVRLVDGNASALNETELVHVCRDANPDVVLLSSSTPTFAADLRSAQLVKQTCPGAVLAMFGAHVSATAEAVVATGHVDVVIRNEPERVFANMLPAMLRHESPQMTRGITRRVDGAVVSSPDEDPIENLDDIPWPDRSLLDNSMYINPLTGKVFTVIRPSRGCPGRCLFCVGFYYGKTWRTRSVPNIVDELEECVRRYGIADFLLNADLFTQNKAHVIAFCTEILRRRLDVTWVCNSRVDTVDEERLSWMKKAGCQLISLGIESGNDEILANVRKGTRRDTIVRGIEAIRRSGIKSLGYFVFGLPGETTATVEHTIRFALELPLDYAHFMTATPYPGTELARYLAGNNLITSTEWARYDETRCDVYDLPGLTGAQIRKAARRAYLRWYFRPRILFRTMAECVTSVGIRRNLSLLAGLFRQRHGRRPAVHRPM